MKIALFLAWFAAAGAPAAPAPVVLQSGPGRFEIVAADPLAARAATAAADECWHMLTAPLGLPEGFSSPVAARLVSTEEWADPAAFRVRVEPGGAVSARVRWSSAADEPALRRALVQALLLRLAVARDGVSEKLTAPLWLELACVEWWRTRTDPARLGALEQASERTTAPALVDLLGWQRGGAEPPEWSAGGMWLMVFLRGEATTAGEWGTLLSRLLAGDEPVAALAAAYPGRFRNASERELWWATGWQHLRRDEGRPLFTTAESRQQLVALSRFVFTAGGRDTVLTLSQVAEHAREPEVAAELQRRATALGRIAGALHPVYRDTGLALAKVFAASASEPRSRSGLAAEFDRAWRAATERERAPGEPAR